MEKPLAIAAALMTRICGERGLDAGFLACWARREREGERLEAEGKRKRKGGSDVCVLYLKGAAVSKRNKRKFSILSRRIIYSFPLLWPIFFFSPGAAHLFLTTLMHWLVLVSCRRGPPLHLLLWWTATCDGQRPMGVFLSCEWRVTWRDRQRWLDGGIMRRRRGSGAAACWKQPDVQCVVGPLKNGAGTRQRPPHRPATGICFFVFPFHAI